MVTISDFEPRLNGLSPAGGSGSAQQVRLEGFRRARRHSRAVRLLRLALPLMCVAIVGFYGFAVLHQAGLVEGLPKVNMPRITPADLTMHNPHYEGETDSGGTYRVSAKTARQELGKSTIISLTSIDGDMLEANKTRTVLTATSGTFDTKTNVLVLQEQIDIVSDDGMKAKLKSATVRTKEGLITSEEPVAVAFPAGTVSSKKLRILQKEREVTFNQSVVANLKPAAPKAESGSMEAGVSPASEAEKLFGASDKPVKVTSSRLDIKDAEQTAIFTGKVRAFQDGSSMTTPEMLVHYEGAARDAASGERESADARTGGGKVKRILAKGPVEMRRGAGERVTAEAAVFDAENETALLDGKVVMTALPDRRATGDRAEIDQRSDTLLLTGNVFVAQGENELKGRRLHIDRKSGHTSLTSPPMQGEGPGRISARLVQGESAASAKKPGSSGPAEKPPQNVANITSFRSEPGTPLDIEADALDVDDNSRIAIFRGSVKARQGTMIMQSSEIKAHYSGSARLADVTDVKPEASRSGGMPTGNAAGGTELTRVEASGDVEITSADGRKVTGDWATFDAKSNTIVVGGEVGLTQGSSLVRGQRLKIDLNTGQSTIDTTAPKVAAEPAGGGWRVEDAASAEAGSKGDRPSAIFFPNEVRNATPNQKPAQKPAVSESGEASGWNSQSLPAEPR